MKLTWKPQEIPFEDPESSCMFDPTTKRLVATPAALAAFSADAIAEALGTLAREARRLGGLDYLQAFHDENGTRLWVIEDVVITVLLPEDY